MVKVGMERGRKQQTGGRVYVCLYIYIYIAREREREREREMHRLSTYDR